MSHKSEIYRRTLSFLVAAALREALPSRGVYAGHLLGGSYCYTFACAANVSERETDRLKEEMQRLIERDIEIRTFSLNYSEALAYFEKNGQEDTALLLRQRGKDTVKVNQLNDFLTLYGGPLLPRTGLVSLFDIIPCREGFFLDFPKEYGGGFTEKNPEVSKAFSVYKEYMKWGRITGAHSAGHVNRIIAEGRVKEFIRINEAFQAKKLSAIADEIYKRRDDIKVVLLAGPSSSGKTTTAKQLSTHLEVLGIRAINISLDDYYLHPDKAPKDENGQPDLECLEALDVDYLNKQLLDLLDGKEATLPVYDFKTRTRAQGRTIRLGARREVLIIEGIHGLNDALTPQIKAENKFKLYVSALSQIGLDGHNRVSSSDNRLLRRIVRDRQFRGMSARRTLAMWESVERGAEKYVFRFENSACALFNSAFDYEIPVLKCYAEPLLREIKPGYPEYVEAERLLYLLDNFTALPPQFVPGESILREFIGGSDFKY
ncbi:MAG: nucleoside kinase [Spirochaetaceae bacterium]|nr:nucleoside kinase [Spirochaetaceae bacterium]